MKIQMSPFNTSILTLINGFFALLICTLPVPAEVIDRIVAIVEDDVVLDSELGRQVYDIKQKIAASDTPLPPDFVIRRQVLERIIINKLQLQLATKSNIKVDDEILQKSMLELAQRNGMTMDEFQQALSEENIAYSDFVEDMRNEILIGRLRTNQVNSRIKITERQLQHYMITEGRHLQEQKVQYHIAHILISTPEAASPMIVQSTREKAESTVEKLRNGANFRQIAIGVSDGAQALNGGDLGWRRLSQIPTLFVEVVLKMKKGMVEGPIRSPSGFHIIKLIDAQGIGKHIETQTRVRHILIKTNELINDEDAKQRLLRLRQRIEDGDDFAVLARSHSDDKASALNGGDLGWIGPGALVPAFEQVMNRTEINAISDPLQTQFGWHMIQVLERQERDNTDEYKKEQAMAELRKRKIEEETELWLRRLRDEAYVEIKI